MSWMDAWADHLPTLLGGLWVSVRVAALALLIGLPAGLLLAIGNNARIAPLRWLTVALVEAGRGLPSLVMLLLIYYGLPTIGVTIDAFWCASVALGLTTSAYTSEIIRGGLQAVPQGESEAAAALGLNRADTLRFIVIPQGVRIAIPPLMGFAILIFQATSLVLVTSLQDLMALAQSISSTEFDTSVFYLAALMYAVITVPAGWLVDYSEKRMSRHL
jgi:polar amino acid transport system permease protein